MFFRSIIWADETFDLVAEVLTGEYYRYIRSVWAPIVSSEAFDEDARTVELDAAINEVAAFCCNYLARDGRPLQPIELIEFAAKRQARIFPELPELIIYASGWNVHRPAIDAYYLTTYEAVEYSGSEAEKKGGPCECLECSGRLQIDDECLFRQAPLTPAGRKIGSLDPALVNEFWDRPLALYQHAMSRRSAEAARYALDRFERQSETERIERHNEQSEEFDTLMSHLPRA